MGFWHTGYLEFHDEAGLGYTYRPEKPVYHCQHCGSHFDSIDALRRHRFESHPYTRPLLFVRGIELGASPFRITRMASAADFVVERCTEAAINGESVAPEQIPKRLAHVANDKVRVELVNEGAPAAFELVFRIADEKHLAGVESSFIKMASKGILTIHTVEDFILECKPFDTADGYCDGICHYLYGVLAKERAPDSSLSYEEYRERFNRAADALMDYDRPLARIVRGLVAFHFNHFADAAVFAPPGRLRMAAHRFMSVLNVSDWDEAALDYKRKPSAPEDLLTDHETLRVLRWAEMPLTGLSAEVEEILALAKRDVPEFDRMKLNILLAEASAARGDADLARKTARELIANPKTAGWAEQLIARMTEKDKDA